MDDDDDDLRQLRADYASDLPGKVDAIVGGWIEVKAGQWDGDRLQALTRQAHDLAGSAGSYGFPSVSDAAREVEQAFKSLPESTEFPARGDLRRLESAMTALQEVGHRLAKKRGPNLPHQAAPPALSGRILVIEDDPAMRSLLRALLQRHGLEVILCGSGEEGIALATEWNPDLILLDVSMPEMDGYEVCYRLQNARRTYHIPIAFVTAHRSEQDRAKAFAVGASDYLVKPVVEGDLLATVRRCLARNERWQGLEPESQGPATLETRLAFDFGKFKDDLIRQAALPADVAGRLSRMAWDEMIPLTELAGIRGKELATLIATFCGLPYVPGIDPGRVRLGMFPAAYCRSHQVVAVEGAPGETDFVISNPFDWALMDALYQALSTSPGHVLITESANIEPLLAYSPPTPTPDSPMPIAPGLGFGEIEERLRESYQVEEVSLNVDGGVETSAPIILLVNKLIETAHEMGASDIHVEPWEHEVVIRYRIDGHLRIINRLKPQRLIFPLVARLKVMSGLDISERRLPQDGRIAFKEFSRGRMDLDLRVATSPMHFGEKVVMRLIDRQKTVRPLHELGFSDYNLTRYRETITSPYGMVLHVGPTGSGKSLTLYAALNEIQTPAINIQTAEDPIEYTLPGLNQLQVRPDIGLTFARALRSYLRQDPDVILIGEIRDRETADAAVEAALTGHLLLSTLHTNDAASTVARFLEMGFEPYMISSSIVMICAQRLVRRLCPACRIPHVPDAAERTVMGMEAGDDWALFTAGRGCEACRGIGFAGRVGIHELLILDDGLRAAISRPGITTEAIKRQAVETGGMRTLFWDAMAKVRAGLCALDDVLTTVVPDDFPARPPGWNA